MDGDDMEHVAVELGRRRLTSASHSLSGALSDGVEYRLDDRSASCEMTRRISLVAVCCSSASVSSRFRASQLLEQPDVLDGDDRLVGEGPK